MRRTLGRRCRERGGREHVPRGRRVGGRRELGCRRGASRLRQRRDDRRGVPRRDVGGSGHPLGIGRGPGRRSRRDQGVGCDMADARHRLEPHPVRRSRRVAMERRDRSRRVERACTRAEDHRCRRLQPSVGPAQRLSRRQPSLLPRARGRLRPLPRRRRGAVRVGESDRPLAGHRRGVVAVERAEPPGVLPAQARPRQVRGHGEVGVRGGQGRGPVGDGGHGRYLTGARCGRRHRVQPADLAARSLRSRRRRLVRRGRSSPVLLPHESARRAHVERVHPDAVAVRRDGRSWRRREEGVGDRDGRTHRHRE